jgi:hypothetical protein
MSTRVNAPRCTNAAGKRESRHACRACHVVWFDEPTYLSLPELAFDRTNFMPMQTTEIIAMERLEELKKRMEEERKQARKKKPLHRILKPEKDSGNLIKFGTLKVNGDPRIGNPSRDRWFNTQAFAPENAYTLRTNPFYYDGLTGPLTWNLDSTLAKNFYLTERTRFELRMDAFNLPNHFLSTMPNNDPRSSLFGRSTGQSNLGREMQYTLRLHF